MRYRKPSKTTLAATLVLAIFGSLMFAFSNPVEVRVDGQPVISDVPPVTTPKEVYVPLRPVGNALGAETRYEHKSGDVVVTRGDETMHLKVGSTHAKINGVPVTLKHAPFRVRGRIMVSLARRSTSLRRASEIQSDHCACRREYPRRFRKLRISDAVTARGLVLNVRKLAAIDLYFLGAKVIITEYAVGVLGLVGFGAWALHSAVGRGHSAGLLAFGAYLISIGTNYIPLLVQAVRIARTYSVSKVLGDELSDRTRAMRKYRMQSLMLLVPFAAVILSLTQRRPAR